MAPPSPRRPGFSRRAQYGLFAGYVAAILGALLGLLLIVTARVDPAGHFALQSALADLFSPISSVTRTAFNAVKGGFSEVGAYFEAGSKNRAMADELKRARTALIKGKADALENRRLKRLLRLIEQPNQIVTTARLISSTGASSRRYATLSAGAQQGVTLGQPVRSAEGLVGRVIQRGQFVSRILLITDNANIVPVKRVTDGVPALAIGLGDGRIELRPLAAGTNPFAVGDVFVTSGTGGIYQPNIPVAVGVQRGRDRTVARPLANPDSLDFAVVERVYVIPPPALPVTTSEAPN